MPARGWRRGKRKLLEGTPKGRSPNLWFSSPSSPLSSFLSFRGDEYALFGALLNW